MASLLRFIGAFHPIAVHFPIALLTVAALAEAAKLKYKDNPTLDSVVLFNLHLGAVAAVAAAVLGWADAATMGVESELRPILFWHRWLGTGSALLFLVVLWLWHRQRHAVPNKGNPWLFRVFLWLGTFLLALTGHLGGTLVYGIGYLSGHPQF
ncbi:MAG: DUF2231 domain-containing protein [Verrucomicrobiales bacterium]|jgi:uncharacterized membrane protein|nr:DUF2231 domain-containing protein [Verrucomicrobiales bacterium]